MSNSSVPSLNPQELEIRLAGVTHEMNRPPPNQDAFIVVNPTDRPEMLASRGRLLVVCDGMGGEAGGAHAAQQATRVVEQVAYSDPSAPAAHILQAAISQANRQVHSDAMQNPAYRGMGTTCTAALIQNNTLIVGHVGDTRAYLVRGTAIKLLTTDHSRAQLLVEAGAISKEEAETHPTQSMLVRSVGPKPEVEVDIIRPVQLQDGDTVLLCSDGLNKHVKDAEIAQTIGALPDENQAVKHLMDMARTRGGTDNCTVIIAGIGKSRPRSAAAAIPPTMISPGDPGELYDEPLPKRGLGMVGVVAAIAAAIIVLLCTYIIMTKDKPDATEKTSQSTTQQDQKSTVADNNRIDLSTEETYTGGPADTQERPNNRRPRAPDPNAEQQAATPAQIRRQAKREAERQQQASERRQREQEELGRADDANNAKKAAQGKTIQLTAKVHENCSAMGPTKLTISGPADINVTAGGKHSQTAPEGHYIWKLFIKGDRAQSGTPNLRSNTRIFCHCKNEKPSCSVK